MVDKTIYTTIKRAKNKQGLENDNQRRILIGKYVFNYAVEFLSNEENAKEATKENQARNIANAIDDLCDNFGDHYFTARDIKRVPDREDAPYKKSKSLQNTIISYVFSSGYTDESFLELGRLTERVAKAKAIDTKRKKQASAKSMFETEHWILEHAYAVLKK